MFLVQNEDIAKNIILFYNNPDNFSYWNKLNSYNLIDKIDHNIHKIKNLSIDDFIHNNEWIGINPDIDNYLPSFVYTTNDNYIIPMGSIIRKIIVKSDQIINSADFRINTMRFTNNIINITPFEKHIIFYLGIPWSEIYRENFIINTEPSMLTNINISITTTLLPIHVLIQLKNLNNFIFHKFYIKHGKIYDTKF